MPQPVMLSIVTINFNDAAGLRKTVESVARQTFSDLEFIVIDGGSTDASTDVIREFQESIAYWVSEKDEGIYHAMNKGIAKSRGNYVLFLNSGDSFASDDVLKRSSVFMTGEYDLLYGNSQMKGKGREYVRIPAEKMLFSDFINKRGPHHQSSFIRRMLFQEIGSYNEKNKILSDWEFFMKVIFQYKKKIKYLPFSISCYDLNGISSIESSRELLKREKEQIIRENFPGFAEDYNELSFYKNSVANSRVIKAYLRYFKGIKL